jgi:integrase
LAGRPVIGQGAAFSGHQLPRPRLRQAALGPVALVVKRLTAGQGIEGDFSGHSLRAGLATAAAFAGVPERAIMNQTGHKSLATMRKYIREGSLFLENAAGRVGL